MGNSLSAEKIDKFILFKGPSYFLTAYRKLN